MSEAEPHLLNDTDRWDEWITGDIPASSIAHAERCDRCQKAYAELLSLKRGLGALREAEKIEPIADRVISQIPRARRRAILALALTATAAAAAVVLLGSRATIEVIGTEGVTRLSLPATIETRDTPVSVRGSVEPELELAAMSALAVHDPRTFELVRGALAARARSTFSIKHANLTIEASGEIEVVAEETERAMSWTKTKSVVAGAVLAVAIYGGWAKISTGSEELEQTAPGGVAAGANGKLRPFELDRHSRPAAKGAGFGSTSLALSNEAAGKTDPQDAERPSGAFWSEEKSTMIFALDGEVFDAVSGAPITEFVIDAHAIRDLGYGSSGHRTFGFRDRKDGKFRITGLGVGEWRLTASAENKAPLSQTIDLTEVSANPYLVMPLSGGARVSGQVVDWRGRPVAEAKVGLPECFDRRGEKTCRIVETESDGRFTLEEVPAGETFAIRAEHERYGSSTRRNLRRNEGETEHVVIELSGILRVFGKVTRGKEAAPVAGAIVIIGEGERRVTTGADGGYEALVPLGTQRDIWVETKTREGHEVRFAAHPRGRSADAIRWVSAETHVAEMEKSFRIAAEQARLFGRVTGAAGKAVAGVELIVHNSKGWFNGQRGHETFPARTKTDAEGRYAIDNIPTQAGYSIDYRDAKGGRHELGFVNIPSEGEVEANFQLGTGSIRGRFVKNGAPFKASPQDCSRLGATEKGSKHYVEARCFEDGRFEISGLAGGTYVLEDVVSWMTSALRFEPKTIELAPGAIVEGVELEATSGEESDLWKLRVIDEHGSLLSGVYLRFHQEKTTFTSNLDVGLDGVSSFTLNRVHKKVFLDHQGYESQELDLTGRDPAQIINVRLRKTAN